MLAFLVFVCAFLQSCFWLIVIRMARFGCVKANIAVTELGFMLGGWSDGIWRRLLPLLNFKDKEQVINT